MKINIAHHFICLYRLHYSFCATEYFWQACHNAVFYRAKFLGFRVLCCINPYYEKRIEIHKHGIIIPYQLDKNDNITCLITSILKIDIVYTPITQSRPVVRKHQIKYYINTKCGSHTPRLGDKQCSMQFVWFQLWLSSDILSA